MSLIKLISRSIVIGFKMAVPLLVAALMLSACTKKNEGTISVTTNAVTEITGTSAKTGGSVTSSGYSISDCGVCYSESHNPTLNDSFTKDHEGTGSFISTLSNLKSGTTYYVRAYAKASSGVEYGDEKTFKTLDNGGGNGGGGDSGSGYTINVFADPTAGGTVTGAGTYQEGQSCTVTAIVNTGYTFTSWTENGTAVSNNESYCFTVSGNRNLTANFSQNSYSIAVSIAPENSGTVTGIGNYNHGQSCTLVATANSGYAFTNWTEDGEVVSNNASYTFSATGNRALVANFEIQTYTISVTANPSNGGNVSGGGSNFTYGQNCTVEASASNGYKFKFWKESGVIVSSNASYTFTVTGDRTLEAVFSNAPTGAIDGLFSVSASKRVYFSKGNLQYQASSRTWRFAEHQYDYIGTTVPASGVVGGTVPGSSNHLISSTYSGWIDLFGWGTSGNNHGAICYQPWSIDEDPTKYYAYGSFIYNLYDQTGKADWGANIISDSPANTWRSLTKNEWEFLLFTRNTESGIRFAKAEVAGVNGVILLPDGWNSSLYSLIDTNNPEADYYANYVSNIEWSDIFEINGAVFLPVTCYRGRDGEINNNDNSSGYYWTSSYYDNQSAYSLSFHCGWGASFYVSFLEIESYYRSTGHSVRLVYNIE